MVQIQITNQETLSNRKFLLQFVTYNKSDAAGKDQELNAEIYFRPDAVAVLLYNAGQEKFIFTRQFRLASFLNGNTTGYLTEACAGLIDEGETPEQTAIREVSEELGYEIDNLKKAGGVYTSAGGITEYVHLFIAAYDDSKKRNEGGGLPEEGEDIESIELSFTEAREMLKQGKINDAKTVMLLQHYFLFC